MRYQLLRPAAPRPPAWESQWKPWSRTSRASPRYVLRRAARLPPPGGASTEPPRGAVVSVRMALALVLSVEKTHPAPEPGRAGGSAPGAEGSRSRRRGAEMGVVVGGRAGRDRGRTTSFADHGPGAKAVSAWAGRDRGGRRVTAPTSGRDLHRPAGGPSEEALKDPRTPRDRLQSA